MDLPGDVQAFQNGYRGMRDDPSRSHNLEFYMNERRLQPNHQLYENFMEMYSQDYKELEANHGYIQWLFPIPEQGVNHRAQPLQEHERQRMANEPIVIDRLLRSYCMMMAFYGIKVDTANHCRLSLTKDHKERLTNLSYRVHNLLRITRILKLLGLFPPLSPLAAPLIVFFVALHSDGLLNLSKSRMHGDSLERWWANCLRDEAERTEVGEIVRNRGRFGAGDWGMTKWDEWFDQRRAAAAESVQI